MDTSKYELLVHITACSTARDDKRYISIAQSILNFRPATHTKVSGPEPDTLTEISTEPQDTPRKVSSSEAADPLRLKSAPERCSTDPHEHFPASARGARRSFSTLSSFGGSFATSPGCHPTGKPRHSSLTRPKASRRSNSPLSESCPGIVDRTSSRKRRRLEGERANDNDRPSHHMQETYLSDLQCRPLPRSRSFPVESSVRRSPDSPCSTVSPSQPLRHDCLISRPQPHESSGSHGCAFVDLTTPEHPRQDAQQSQSQPRSKLHLARPVQALEVQSESSRQAQQPVVLIRQLADDVRGPNPTGGQLMFTTHLTKTLERVSTRVPLSKYFRPARVVRDVGVLERGYWQFFVRIGDGSGRESRQSSGRPSNSPPWTEKDFARFWREITKFIQQGKAGWATRLMKESRGGNEWRIRLFTWAELLGHIWVILWILSDKLTQETPMQWIAGDGSVIVHMSGTHRRRRRSRVWLRTGPEGEGGVWGLRPLGK